MTSFCLEVSGDFACFTRPEMKVERVSYDVITPSAARSVFEAILWKPAIRWEVRRIEVLKPIKWISVRRNEVSAKASVRNAQTAMNAGQGNLALYIEDDRQQRAGLFLRDVAYRLHADLLPVGDDARANPAKYREMFQRRQRKGSASISPISGAANLPPVSGWSPIRTARRRPWPKAATWAGCFTTWIFRRSTTRNRAFSGPICKTGSST